MAEDRYASWRAELAGQKRNLPRGVAADGFYEVRLAKGRMALAVWYDKDIEDLMARVGEDGDDVLADEAWCEKVFSKSKAIYEEVYRDVMAGKGWPEQKATAPAPKAEDTGNPHADRPNTPPAKHVDIADRGIELDREIKAWVQSIGGTIKTQEHADKAGEFKVRLVAIEKEAGDGKREEKAPVLAEADRLEKQWAPIVSDRKRSRERITDLIGEFLKAETKRRQDEARALADANKATGVEVKAAPVRAGGKNGGRATGLVTVQNLVFDDEAKAYAQISATDTFRNDADVRAVFMRMAKLALRGGLKVEGARLVEEQLAR